MNSPTHGPAHILVVDDFETSRCLTAGRLRRGGHEVTEVVTGAQALRVLGEQDVDLVMLDVRLPDIDGYEVCRRIKADPRTSAIPVIHVSATPVGTDTRTAGLNRGADAYLTEPVDPDELLATVEVSLRPYRARRLAERLADRLARLTAATLRVNGAATFAELAAAAATGTAEVFGTSAVVLVGNTDNAVCAARADGAGAGGVKVTTRTLVAPVLREVAVAAEHADLAVVTDFPGREGMATAVAMARGKSRRAPVCVAVEAAAAATDEDRGLLRQLAQTTALAADALRAFAEEHDLALALQRGMLPQSLPEDTGLPMAVRYVPASATAEVGGDFYEVTELDGKLLVAIGDVCGHSITAATIMGEVRHALRAYAVEGHDPVALLTRLDRMLERFHPLRGLTTVCLLLVDLEGGTMTVANAGHVPPLVADAAGARYLEVAGPLLGVGLPHPPASVVPLPPGTLVVLTTDGLVERSGVDLDEGMELLRAAVSWDDDGEELCDRLIERFGRDKRDDIALLVFRRP
ncbi:serine phosphatase RsbU (regulator of sigma subunit)/DNA-binding response OmpR family regulator [Saccharothrix coeruleofusca]|uniref:fused response regulator/phosphatase n=1 Tax=Saccharothrix coeruleofusca TaxID=33919 RepID=UPI001AE161B3|nr:fused response regulator/phosphatase [Saccharothrix coeruleofusca]MBP2336212.1 serine phosphatase RsbU (regulator of sigma subunit)/DNA-binding response OmpR family regulator [Saccharothrix coeruleofusca]